MRRLTRLLLITVILIAFRPLAFGQSPDFSGTWVLNFSKSKLEDNTDGLTGQLFVIRQEGDQFRLKIHHFYGAKERKIGFRMRTDGKTRRVKIIFKGKLEQTPDGLKASMWRKNYSNVVTYRFGADQNELVADEVYTGSPRNHHSIWVFDRQRPETGQKTKP